MEFTKKNLSLIRESVICYIETIDSEINRLQTMAGAALMNISAPALSAKREECRYLLEDIDVILNKE